MDDVRRISGGEGNKKDGEEVGVTLDDLAREGARRMIAAALEAEVGEYSRRSPTSLTRTASGWWSVTVVGSSGG